VGRALAIAIPDGMEINIPGTIHLNTETSAAV